ncbi:hypothetical protein SBA4_2330017 [Candidatus Sulfopaludibacter sp. SbA4]|nr:hypothetical protein SBA4_2330017 [Candidatus Sulfopaludibacter sp. SbA4]
MKPRAEVRAVDFRKVLRVGVMAYVASLCVRMELLHRAGGMVSRRGWLEAFWGVEAIC